MPANVIGEVVNLAKRFGNVDALQGVSFQIHRGANGIIGPNGAGKTTLIKILMGLLKPDAGNARVFGFDCWKDALEVRTRVGVMYEKVAFYDHMSGIEYLELIAKLRGSQNASEEAKEALVTVGLEFESSSRFIGTYSAGMRQRLGIAQALLCEPDLVILDEPTANLDPIGRIHLLKTIKTLSGKGVAFLISSHILPELEKICDKIVIVNKGRILRKGSLRQLLDEIPSKVFSIRARPLHLVVEKLRREPNVEKVYLKEERVCVIAKDSEAFKKQLPLLIFNAGAHLEEFRNEGKNLETLFSSEVS